MFIIHVHNRIGFSIYAFCLARCTGGTVNIIYCTMRNEDNPIIQNAYKVFWLWVVLVGDTLELYLYVGNAYTANKR